MKKRIPVYGILMMVSFATIGVYQGTTGLYRVYQCVKFGICTSGRPLHEQMFVSAGTALVGIACAVLLISVWIQAGKLQRDLQSGVRRLCSNCGALGSKRARFCGRCGTALNAALPDETYVRGTPHNNEITKPAR